MSRSSIMLALSALLLCCLLPRGVLALQTTARRVFADRRSLRLRQPYHWSARWASAASSDADEDAVASTGSDESGAALVADETGDAVSEEKVPEDPDVKLLKEMETKLQSEISQLESQLRMERLNLSKVKDQVSESGKNGFFMVQAQVANFLKKNEIDQKNRVATNKREFVLKMLDVVDKFRRAPKDVPAESERETNMHVSFGALLNGILSVFEKYGFKEVNVEAGAAIDPLIQEVEETDEGHAEGVVLRQLRSGWADNEGEIVRKVLVAAKLAKPPVPPPAPTPAPASESSESTPEEEPAAE
jgi:molecular chaperone GrpE (heat shock protein)